MLKSVLIKAAVTKNPKGHYEVCIVAYDARADMKKIAGCEVIVEAEAEALPVALEALASVVRNPNPAVQAVVRAAGRVTKKERKP